MTDFVTIIHECKDYPTWKTAYDADAPNRKSAGLTDLHCLRDADKPNLIALMFQASDIARAKQMMTSPELAARMTAAGIIGPPRIRYRTGQYTPVSAPMYVTLTAQVRDFDTAMKAYAMDAADRKAATLTDLAVLQSKDDPENILLLWSVTDPAKATAFFDSPKLAEHMVKTAGVVGAPERHFWKV
jgi:hypothetical protein